MVQSPSAGRSIFSRSNSGVVEDDEIEEMVKGASVLRKKAEAPATGRLRFDAERARRISYSDYTMPPMEFLNEAPPHSEQADSDSRSLWR